MQKFLSKYALAAHLALLAVAPLFLFPFVGDDAIATVLLWLAPLTLVWVLMEPSRRADEMLHDARQRVAAAIAVDPLFWFLLAVAILAGLRWANDGIKMAYDAETFRWFLKEPAIVFLPGCLSGRGALPFAATLSILVLVTGCRHALGKSARVAFLFAATSFAGCAALVAVAGCALGHAGCLRAAACAWTDASFAGTAFALHFLGGLVGLVGAYERKWGSAIFFYSLGVGGTAAGLYFFAPVPVIGVFLAAGILLLAASLVSVGWGKGRTLAFKCLASLMLASLVPVLCAFGFAPAGLNEERLAPFLGDGTLFPGGFEAMRNLLSSIAAKVFWEHPWIGTGLGSFPLDIKFGATAADWPLLTQGQASALNGWWQLVAERGIVGALFFAVALGFLGWTFVRRLVACFGKSFFVPVCLLGPVAAAAVAVETFFDVSFLRADVLMALAAFIALAGAALPAVRPSRSEASNPKQESANHG